MTYGQQSYGSGAYGVGPGLTLVSASALVAVSFGPNSSKGKGVGK